MSAILKVMAAVFLVLMVVACGQKGPLTLPEKQPTKSEEQERGLLSI